MDSDGRIRCNYLQHGTVTGRLSSQNPNLQNVPDKSHFNLDIRKAFIPTHESWFIVEGDYNQLELRVTAHCTQDKALIKAYVEDRDFHSDTSVAVLRKPDASAWERSLVKNIVFGALYGRGAESITYGPEMDHVAEIGEQRWTLKETEIFFRRFFSQYPQLRDWQVKQREIAYREQRIETPMGRIRRFPFIGHNDNGAVGRQAMNTPIQSVASDITLDALIRIHSRLSALNKRVGRIVAHIILTVHDSITAECHPKYLKQVVKIFEEEMQRVPIKSNVPFKVKISVGHTWSECK
jgi:DNA polymerase-1